jgi:hypothetical protein
MGICNCKSGFVIDFNQNKCVEEFKLISIEKI